MRPAIGNDYIYKQTGEVVHVQDVNHIKKTAFVGVPDSNGIVWNTFEVGFSELCPLSSSAEVDEMNLK